LKVRLSAARTATWAGEAFALLKNIPAQQALKRQDNEFFSLRCQGTRNMRKVLIDLLFPDAYGLREFPGAHLPFVQEDHHLLTNG
jgi:hypothetical protein